MEERTIQASDGTRLWVGDHPTKTTAGDRAPIVFLHGYSGSSSAAAALARAAVSSGHRLITPDLRGHGLSGKPSDADAYTLERFVRDVLELLDAFDLGRVHLVGHCMGGMVAAAFAIAHPERLLSLALVGTSLDPAADRHAFSIYAVPLRVLIRPIGRLAFPSVEGAGRHLDYSSFRKTGDLSWQRTCADWRQLTWGTGELITNMFRTLDCTRAAMDIDVPTLVAHGAHDTIFPPHAALRSHAAIPGSSLLVLPRDNHVTLVLDPTSSLFAELVAHADAAERSGLAEAVGTPAAAHGLADPPERREVGGVREANRQAGFTLVEIMVALVVIGILLAIAVPVFSAASKNAKARACVANLRTLDAAVEQWKARTELDPAERWGGPSTDQDPYACGSLVDDLSPSISNWNDAIYCTSIHMRHHVDIEELSGGHSTASFRCTGGVDGVPHEY